MEKKKSIQKKTAYEESTIISKFITEKKQGKPLKIAFVDIDSTLTGHPTVTKKAREKLEALGYALIFVTARTEEMMMSKEAYEKSLVLGFSRPKPHLAKKNNAYTYVDPKIYNTNLVDPDIIIGSTGTQILVKQLQGGFLTDSLFEKEFALPSNAWRKNVLDMLQRIDPEKRYIQIADIESETKYEKRETNIYPTKYRVKIMFSKLEEKMQFLEATQQEKCALLFHFIDDSHPDKKRFMLYITPQKASKRYAVEHVVEYIVATLKQRIHESFEKADLHVLLAGDSYPDLTMLLYGAAGTKATAIAVGGSRLTRVLTHESLHTYAGENMKRLKKNLKISLGKKGHYAFTDMLGKQQVHIRNIIFGDHAFPKTIGPETILAYLDQLTVTQ